MTPEQKLNADLNRAHDERYGDDGSIFKAAADDPRDRLLAEEGIRLAARNRMLHAALSRTLSALTAYGGHHNWCDWKADHKSPCNCGFDGEVIVARESLDATPPPQPEVDSPALDVAERDELDRLRQWVAVRKARDKRARDRYRERHPEVHRKSARESMARTRSRRAALRDTP